MPCGLAWIILTLTLPAGLWIFTVTDSMLNIDLALELCTKLFHSAAHRSMPAAVIALMIFFGACFTRGKSSRKVEGAARW